MLAHARRDHLTRSNIMAKVRREYLHALTLRAGGNLTQAAKMAKIDRANLRRLLRSAGLNADDYRTKN